MPFKNLIWKFSQEADSRKYSRNFSQVSLTCKLLAKQSQNSLSKAEKTLKLDHLTPSWAYIWNGSWKHPENIFFHTKTTWKTLINIGDTNHFQKETKRTKKSLFGLIHIWLSTHTSHLNMYNHTNEISIHWTLNLCVMCVDQVWNSP